MIRSFTIRLKPTRRQNERMAALLEECRELYNAALGERKSAWETCRQRIGYYDQQRELTVLRGINPESAEFPSGIQRDPLRRIQRAFDAFFRRIKAGETPGYPRFRSKGRYDSFSADSGSFSVRPDGTIKIVGLGCIQLKTRTKWRGIPKELHVKRCGEKWVAQLVCDIGPAPERVIVGTAIGIDLGLTTLATLSDGTEILNPRWTKREEGRLAKANQSLARKTRGSNNRAKAREHLRRVHQRIAGLRSSYLTAAAKILVGRCDLIAHEDLAISEMARSKFAKGIMDAAWSQFIHRLNCEAEKAGKWVVPVNPRGTTQQCSGCSKIVPKKIWQRVHQCPSCGLTLGRDHNAALNVLRLGESLAATQNVPTRVTAVGLA